jgi:hypothetical protein
MKPVITVGLFAVALLAIIWTKMELGDMPQQTPIEPTKKSGPALTWCDGIINRIEVVGDSPITLKGTTWLKNDKELNLAQTMDNWCPLSIKVAGSDLEPQNCKPIIRFGYQSGEPKTLENCSKDLYRFGEIKFESSLIRVFVSDLKDL